MLFIPFASDAQADSCFWPPSLYLLQFLKNHSTQYGMDISISMVVTSIARTSKSAFSQWIITFWRGVHIILQIYLLGILTGRGTEYCGRIEHHDYQLYLAINDIDHTKTKAMSPQTNDICERFHKTILQEFNGNSPEK